jgi:hypothetical protein
MSQETTKNETTHFCTQEDAINRINLILVGNGHPEDGLAFVVKAMTKDMSEIKTHLSAVNANISEAIKAATTSSSALELYKKETESIERGKVEAEGRQQLAESLKRANIRDNWYKVFTALALIASIYFGFANNKKSSKIETTTSATENKIDTRGVPVVVRNGQVLNLPSGSEIKFYPSDFGGDTTNLKK